MDNKEEADPKTLRKKEKSSGKESGRRFASNSRRKRPGKIGSFTRAREAQGKEEGGKK